MTSRTGRHFFVLVSVLGAWTVPSPAGARELVAAARTYDVGDVRYAALLVRAGGASEIPRAVDVAMLVDLSASQAGAPRERTTRLVRDVAQRLVGGSRVQIWRIERPQAPLMERPAAVGSDALARAVEALDAAVPSGASDFPAALASVDQWLSDKSGSLPKRVVLVGDGQSTLFRLDPAAVAATAKRWREQRVAVLAAWVGPRPEGTLRGLVRSTGGRSFDANSDGGSIAEPLAKAIGVSVLYPDRVVVRPAEAKVLPDPPPPIRPDVDALWVAKTSAAAPVQFAVECPGKRSTIRVDFPASKVEHAFLRPLFEEWSREPARLAVVEDGARSLALARLFLAEQVERAVADASRALSKGESKRAAELYQWALGIEPGHPEAQAGLRASASAPPKTENGNRPNPKSANPAVQEPADLIEEARSRSRVEAQRLARAASEAMREADRFARSDPERAIGVLKRALLTVESSSLDAEDLAGLKRRLEQRLRTVWRTRKRSEVERLERDRVLAEIEARRRRDDAEVRVESTRKERMERYNQLLRAGAHDEAQRAADEAVQADPDSVAANAAAWHASLSSRYARVEDLERRKQDGWWRTLEQVEVAAIPYPDVRIIAYPPAKEWEELSIRRAKYKEGVDLDEASPAEEAIRRALSRPVSFDFQETPLFDVVEFFRNFADINVVLDKNGLQESAVEADTPITLQLEQVPLKSALKLILEPLDLTYSVRDDVLLITSRLLAEQTLLTKVYPVGDLVIPISNIGLAAGAGLGGGLAGGAFGGGALGGGGAGGNQGAAGLGGGRGGQVGGFNFRVLDGPERAKPPPPADPKANPPRPDPGRNDIEEIQKTLDGDAGQSALEGALRELPANSDAPLRVVAGLAQRKDYDKAVGLLEALARTRPLRAGEARALAAACELAGRTRENAVRALLAPVDLRPNDLLARLEAAKSLAELGEAPVAIRLLRDASARFPGSVNVLFLALVLAERSGDVDATAWSAAALLEGAWGPSDAAARAKAKEVLDSFAARSRAKGQAAAAERWAAIARQTRERDLEVVVSWKGEADVDLAVVEPGGVVCCGLVPRTVSGGVLAADDLAGRETYTAVRGMPGVYELLLRPVWGAPTGGAVTVDVLRNAGTKDERRERHTVRLDQGPARLALKLDAGRRSERTRISPDDGLFVDRWFERPRGGSALADLRAAGAAGIDRPLATPPPRIDDDAVALGAFEAGFGGAVAFNPILAASFSGTSLQAQVVVSADRRYVRLTAVPVVQEIVGTKSVVVTGVAR